MPPAPRCWRAGFWNDGLGRNSEPSTPRGGYFVQKNTSKERARALLLPAGRRMRPALRPVLLGIEPVLLGIDWTARLSYLPCQSVSLCRCAGEGDCQGKRGSVRRSELENPRPESAARGEIGGRGGQRAGRAGDRNGCAFGGGLQRGSSEPRTRDSSQPTSGKRFRYPRGELPRRGERTGCADEATSSAGMGIRRSAQPTSWHTECARREVQRPRWVGSAPIAHGSEAGPNPDLTRLTRMRVVCTRS